MPTVTPEDTTYSINHFAKMVKEFSEKKVGDPDAVLETVRKCRTASPQVFEERRVTQYLKARSSALKTLTDQYLVARLSSKFPLVDPGLFMLKRHLTVTKEGEITSDRTKPLGKKSEAGTVRCEVPLFVSVPLFGDHNASLGKYTFRERDYNHGGYGVDSEYHRPYSSTTSYTSEITAKLPTPPENIVNAGRQAVGFYYAVVGEMMQHPDLCDLLAAEPPPPELSVIWIPAANKLNVEVKKKVTLAKVQKVVPLPRSYDPALLLTVGDRNFVVKTYDIVEEEPMEHFLREFTSGPSKLPK